MKRYDTRQKKLVQEFFEANRKKDYTIAEAARALENKVGKSSVYRIVSELEEAGELRRFYDEDEDRFVYRFFDCDTCRRHLHMKCTECGKVYHLSEEETVAISRIVGKEFSVRNDQTTLFGVCKECKNKTIGSEL